MKHTTITFDKAMRTLLVAFALLIVYFLIRRLSSVLIPFLVAWLIAYLLYPIVCFFQYKCRLRSRALSIMATLLVLTGIIAGACWLVIPPIIDEIARLKDIIISFVTTDATVTSLSYTIQHFVRQNVDINQITRALTFSDVTQFLEQRVPQFFSLVGTSLSAIIGIVCSFIAIIYMFFILMDYENMSKGIFNLVPKQQRRLVHKVADDVKRGMNAYFRGQTIVAMLVGILFAIGFLIIDFPLAIPLGLFIGFLNLVPYLQVLGFIPTIVLGLLKAHDSGDSFLTIMLAAVAVFCVVQAIQDWVIVPKVMGKVTGLNAAVILLALSVWGSLLGFVGLIIALPLTSLIVSYYQRYVLEEETHDASAPISPNT